MSDKLINPVAISKQVEFDNHGGYKLTEVLDADVLDAVGGGGDIKIPIPDIDIYCPGNTTNPSCVQNNCGPTPPAPKPPAPTPAPTPPKEPPKGEDGDDE